MEVYFFELNNVIQFSELSDDRRDFGVKIFIDSGNPGFLSYFDRL